MAASLVPYQPYTDTAGATIIVPISGIGTYPLSPASAITGFTATVGGVSDVITAATAANGYVTLTLTVGATAGQAILLSYTPGNLVDSAGTPNTMAAFSNLAVANNAGQTTTGFAYANAAFLVTTDGAVFSNSGGHNRWFLSSQTSEIDFRFTGTQVAVQLQSQSAVNIVTVSIDGAAIMTSPMPGVTWGTWVLASGLTDTLHTCQIKTVALNTCYFDADNLIYVTGSAPAVSSWPLYAGTLQKLSAAPYSANVLVDEELISTGVHGWNVWEFQTNANGHFDFYAECTSFNIWVYQSSLWTVFVDDVLVGTVGQSSFVGWQWVTAATGLSSGVHHIRLEQGDAAPGGSWSSNTGYIWQSIMFFGGGGVQIARPAKARTAWGFYGDSITLNRNPSLTDGYAFKVRYALNRQGFNRGYGGSGVATASTTISGQNRTADLTNITTPLERVLVEYGTNDVTVCTLPQFLAAYIDMMQKLQANVKFYNTKYDVMLIFPRTGRTNATTAIWNYVMINALQSLGSANIQYIDTVPWQLATSTGQNFTPNYIDGTHPNIPGNNVINYWLTSRYSPRRRTTSGHRQGTRCCR